MSRADAVIADEYLDRSQAFFRLGNSVRTALRRSKVCHHVLEPQRFQLFATTGDAYYPGTARGQEFCSCSSKS